MTTSAILLGAMHALREDIGVPVPTYENISYDNLLRALHQQLDDATIADLEQRGRALEADEALARALSAVRSIS